MKTKIYLSALCCALLSACNDGGSSSSPSPQDNSDKAPVPSSPAPSSPAPQNTSDEAPSFTIPASNPMVLSIPENTTLVTAVVASDPEKKNISYAISGGVDASFFTLNGDNELHFTAAPNFEDKKDDGADNSYLVNITATAEDSAVTADLALLISITDVAEIPQASDPKLNDTGYLLCGDYAYGNVNRNKIHNNDNDCALTTETGNGSDPIPAGQDGHYGRDTHPTLNKTGAGRGGFDFTKLDNDGNALADNATEWHCVRDNVTGLIWEVKQGDTGDGKHTPKDEGLHDRDDRYTWYSDDDTRNGGSRGFFRNHPQAGDDSNQTCFGFDFLNEVCNTQAFTKRVNESKLCGLDNWRLPSLTELYSIVDLGLFPAFDPAYFPGTVPVVPDTEQDIIFYLTNQPSAFKEPSDLVLGLSFDTGRYGSISKSPQPVRLVHARSNP